MKDLNTPASNPRVWALDLDGVIWSGTEPINGSAQAAETLIQDGHEVLFATNNSFSTIAQQEEKLASFGIDASGRVVTSAQAAASQINNGELVLVLGGPGIAEAATSAGAQTIDRYRQGDDVPDALIVGLDWDLSYKRLASAVQAVLDGARFLATNDDATYPTEKGLFPGAGAIVAAVAASTRVEPQVCGKPHNPMAQLIRARFGADGMMVGDRPETDGLFAKALGYDFGLVLSGVTLKSHLPVNPVPDVIGRDLAELVAKR